VVIYFRLVYHQEIAVSYDPDVVCVERLRGFNLNVYKENIHETRALTISAGKVITMLEKKKSHQMQFFVVLFYGNRSFRSLYCTLPR